MITDVWHLLIFHERYTNWNWGRVFHSAYMHKVSFQCFTTLVASGTYDSFPTMLTSISLLSGVMPFMTVMPLEAKVFSMMLRCIRFLSTVTPFMNVKTTGSGEGFSIMLTCEFFHDYDRN